MNLFDFFKFSFHAHNEIADNGADAKPCLSDVYKHTARGEKLQADAALCGRSMVEMLGVLAIIGVLSIGAISGYSKAMMKYKLNKQTEQIGSILDGILLYDDVWEREKNSFVSSVYIFPFLQKLNIVPKEMIRSDDKRYIYDVFNNRIVLRFHDANELVPFQYFELSYYLDGNIDICLNLMQSAQLRSAYLRAVTFCKNSVCSNSYYGDSEDSKAVKYLKNMSMDEIHQACQYCDGTESCYLAMLWGGDYY